MTGVKPVGVRVRVRVRVIVRVRVRVRVRITSNFWRINVCIVSPVQELVFGLE